MRKLLILIFLLSSFFSGNLFSQGKTAYANFQILEPGDVKFPTGIKKLVLANRCYQKTFFSDKNNYSQLYELQQFLLSAKSFPVEILQLDATLRNKDAEKVLPPLDWNTVAQLVNNDTTTELVVLEQALMIRFDYVYKNQYGDYPGYSYKNSSGDSSGFVYKNLFTYTYYAAYPYERTSISPFLSSVGTGIVSGTQYFWRIYDLKTKKIIDDYEDRTTDNYYYINPITYPDNPDQYMLLYYMEEISYAYHLLPHWVTVYRDYYLTGNDEMKNAALFSAGGQMDAAKTIWKKLSGNPDPKIARKACYNSALCFEIDNKLDSAFAYVEKSKLLGDQNAPFYMAKLRKRIAVQEKLNEELNSGEGGIAAVKYYQERY